MASLILDARLEFSELEFGACLPDRNLIAAGSTPARALAGRDDEDERQQSEDDAARSHHGHKPRIGTRERAVVECALDCALAVGAVEDEECADQGEAGAGDRKRPASDVADAGDDLAEADADRERGEAGSPPGEIGALVR